MAGAKGDQERARLAYSVNVAGVNSIVARLRSGLAGAEFDLAQTAVRAYANGFVTQVVGRVAGRVFVLTRDGVHKYR